jgi:hypothetical protein
MLMRVQFHPPSARPIRPPRDLYRRRRIPVESAGGASLFDPRRLAFARARSPGVGPRLTAHNPPLLDVSRFGSAMPSSRVQASLFSD